MTTEKLDRKGTLEVFLHENFGASVQECRNSSQSKLLIGGTWFSDINHPENRHHSGECRERIAQGSTALESNEILTAAAGGTPETPPRVAQETDTWVVIKSNTNRICKCKHCNQIMQESLRLLLKQTIITKYAIRNYIEDHFYHFNCVTGIEDDISNAIVFRYYLADTRCLLNFILKIRSYSVHAYI
jgi:hypothetical protein